MSGQQFTTLDAYVAGFLTLKGHKTRLVDLGGKIAFVFQPTDGLRQALDEFNSGSMVRASAYVFEVKSLKGRIHEFRRENGGYHENKFHRT